MSWQLDLSSDAKYVFTLIILTFKQTKEWRAGSTGLLKLVVRQTWQKCTFADVWTGSLTRKEIGPFSRETRR